MADGSIWRKATDQELVPYNVEQSVNRSGDHHYSYRPSTGEVYDRWSGHLLRKPVVDIARDTTTQPDRKARLRRKIELLERMLRELDEVAA